MSFIPPKSFADFYARYPLHCRRAAQRLLKRAYADDDVLDLEQDFLLRLIRLRTIEKFDPAVYDRNATEGMFFAYLNTALTRHFYTQQTKRKRNKRKHTAVSINAEIPGTNAVKYDDIAADGGRWMLNAERCILISQFRKKLKDFPKLLEILDLLLLGYSTAEIADLLGICTGAVHARFRQLKRKLNKF